MLADKTFPQKKTPIVIFLVEIIIKNRSSVTIPIYACVSLPTFFSIFYPLLVLRLKLMVINLIRQFHRSRFLIIMIARVGK